MMFYYAQYTRQVTDFAGIKGPGKIGRRGHLAAARAVNELRFAEARLAPAAASQHYVCLTSADTLQRINDKFRDDDNRDDNNPITAFATVRDNKLKRSVINYRVPRVKAEYACEGVLSKGDTL